MFKKIFNKMKQIDRPVKGAMSILGAHFASYPWNT